MKKIFGIFLLLPFFGLAQTISVPGVNHNLYKDSATSIVRTNAVNTRIPTEKAVRDLFTSLNLAGKYIGSSATFETFANKSLNAITFGTTTNRQLFPTNAANFYCDVINESSVNHTVSLNEPTHTLNGVANGTFTFLPNQRYYIERLSTTTWIVRNYSSSNPQVVAEILSYSVSPNTGGGVAVTTGSAINLTNLVIHSNSANRGNAELLTGNRGRAPVSGLYQFALSVWRENAATTRMDNVVRIFDQATNTVKKEWGRTYHNAYGLEAGAAFSMYLNAGDTFVIQTSTAAAGDQVWGGNDHTCINVTLIR